MRIAPLLALPGALGIYQLEAIVRKLIPTVICSAVLAAFGPATVAQTTPYSDNNTRDNIHYNIHQRGDQNTSQTGTNNQSSQILGSDNQVNQQSGDSSISTQQGTGNTATTQSGTGNTATTTAQQGTQNQSAIGTGNQQSQQMGQGHSADQASSTADANMKNRQLGDSAQKSDRKDDEHANRGWHKGWEQSGRDPASSGSTRY